MRHYIFIWIYNRDCKWLSANFDVKIDIGFISIDKKLLQMLIRTSHTSCSEVIELVVGLFQFCILLTNNFDNHANFMTVGKKLHFIWSQLKV